MKFELEFEDMEWFAIYGALRSTQERTKADNPGGVEYEGWQWLADDIEKALREHGFDIEAAFKAVPRTN